MTRGCGLVISDCGLRIETHPANPHGWELEGTAPSVPGERRTLRDTGSKPPERSERFRTLNRTTTPLPGTDGAVPSKETPRSRARPIRKPQF